MDKSTRTKEQLDALILENVSKWQISKEPLATLTEDQLDIIYKIDDIIKSEIETQEPNDSDAGSNRVIDTYEEYINFYVQLENDLKNSSLTEYNHYYDKLSEQAVECQNLFSDTEKTTEALNLLKEKYYQVTTKTNSLHNLSELLMVHQKQLKDKKEQLSERLHHFIAFTHLYDRIERTSRRINNKEFTDLLDEIDNAINYLNEHPNYKESRIYRIKYESLLSTALNHVYEYVNSIITETIKHVTDPENATVLLHTENTANQSVESAFSLYYGKFQNAACKVKTVLTHIESKINKHIHYENTAYDCQKTYFAQRSPIIFAAVLKALGDLKEQHKNDYSVLFRSACLFVMKVCQDESMCYFYFFDSPSQQLNDYLSGLCQYLYDSLRPSLISINHLEVLTELCSILRKEMLNDQVHSNESLSKFVDTVRQMLEDVEERLVFRTNVFFQHDLAGYKPSPGDLMYPEKLIHIEGIALDLNESRAESRSSIVSIESQEVATINANPLTSFRSYTGNSPADLHGMWYPTVKRTLVCLSRLYFCLDRQTFQGLAQEALSVCVQTIDSAAEKISNSKTVIDGKLFQIKHLLILREQIAPFQVDFTITELALDFSNVKTAAMGLLNNRSKLFTFNSNNALLEFLLEGTPRVKEYLIDSRKEIDKHLKAACEAFINYVTMLLVGNVIKWLQKAETLKNSETPIEEHEFLKPQVLAGILSATQRNIKSKIPEIQRSMQLYLANRETEFILFRPIKNNIVNTFMQMEETLSSGKYTAEDLLIIACPSAEQINVLLCSVSLVIEQDSFTRSRKTSRASRTTEET